MSTRFTSEKFKAFYLTDKVKKSKKDAHKKNCNNER